MYVFLIIAFKLQILILNYLGMVNGTCKHTTLQAGETDIILGEPETF